MLITLSRCGALICCLLPNLSEDRTRSVAGHAAMLLYNDRRHVYTHTHTHIQTVCYRARPPYYLLVAMDTESGIGLASVICDQRCEICFILTSEQAYHQVKGVRKEELYVRIVFYVKKMKAMW